MCVISLLDKLDTSQIMYTKAIIIFKILSYLKLFLYPLPLYTRCVQKETENLYIWWV